MTALYLYALARGDAIERVIDELRGTGGESLRAIVIAGDVVAIAGSLDAMPEVEPTALAEHDSVVRALAARIQALLPFRFGTAMRDEVSIARTLRKDIDVITEALERARGCEQMTLRIFGEAPRAPARASTTRNAAAPTASKRARGPGARYLAARADEHARMRALPEIAPLRDALAPLVRAEVVEHHDAPPLVASIHHLVPRGSASRYEALVRAHVRELEGMRATTSGPWAAYAFAPERLS